jgi:hypothetical protein
MEGQNDKIMTTTGQLLILPDAAKRHAGYRKKKSPLC